MFVNEKMLIGILFTSICMLITSSASEDTEDISLLVRDFVKVIPTPLRVIAVVCWEKEDLLKLSKLLSASFMPHHISCNTFPNMHTYSNSDNLLIVTDTKCKLSMDFLLEMKNNFFTDRQHRWFTFTSSISDDVFNTLHLNINSEFYVATPSTEAFHIFEFYKYHPKDPISMMRSISTWRRSVGFSNERRLSRHSQKHNLMGARLPVSIVVTNREKWKDLWNFRDTDADGFSKHHFMLVEILVDFLNATRFYRKQNLWGYRDRNTGYHSGVYGDLERGYSELAGIAGFMLDSRAEVVDFLPLTTKTDYTFIYRAPRLSYTKNIYVILYERSIWYCLIFVDALVYLVLYLSMKLDWITRHSNSTESEDQRNLQMRKNNTNTVELKNNDKDPEPNAMDVAVLCTEALTLQTVEKDPRNLSGKIALSIYLLFIFFLNTRYSAHITSLLTSPSGEDLTIEDLLTTNIELGAENVSYNYFFLENFLDDPLKQKIYKEKVADNYMDLRKGMELVRDNFFGFHGFAIDTYRIIEEIFPEDKRCGLKLLNFLSLSADTAYSVKKNSTYKDIIKIGLMRIYESGIRWRSYYRIFHGKPRCESMERAFISIGLIDCYYLFLWLAMGILLSLIMLVTEVVVHKYSKK